ncbi:MAG TPA: hypothetical protein VFS08_06205 [Gemmatimonadaceae bacterium]|nr:hypothetical protein [Gemmatimonadaceae bacterium]
MASPPAGRPGLSPVAAQLRRLLLRMVIAVVVLDAVAIGVFYLADVGDGPPRMRTLFVGLWLAATFVVVSFFMRRIRAARRRPR